MKVTDIKFDNNLDKFGRFDKIEINPRTGERISKKALMIREINKKIQRECFNKWKDDTQFTHFGLIESHLEFDIAIKTIVSFYSLLVYNKFIADLERNPLITDIDKTKPNELKIKYKLVATEKPLQINMRKMQSDPNLMMRT
jgi:hypothetical protein